MFYPDEVIEEVRRSNDIVDVVAEYVRLTQKGNSHVGLCPFHNEKTPSFHVSRDKQICHCFGCGAGGNVVSFIMQIENLSFVDAIKLLAERARISLPEAELSKEAREKLRKKEIMYQINVEAAKYFYKNLKSEYGKVGQAYLEKRKLSETIIKSFGLGYSLNYRDDLYRYLKNKGFNEKDIENVGLIVKGANGYNDRFWHRVMFPIFDVHDKVIGFGGRILDTGEPKYLNSSDSEVFNKRLNLYGLNLAKKSRKKEFLIVEGYMDVISLHQEGFNNAVASLGTALTREQALLIRRYVTDVIILYDSDNAGTTAALRAIPILKSAGLTVKVLQVTGAKDPDEYIKAYGKEAFEKLLEMAIDYADFQIEVTKRQYNIEKQEDKIKAIKKLIDYAKSLDNELDKQMYIKKIADEFSVEEKILNNQIKITDIDIKKTKNNDVVKKIEISASYEKSETILLSFMINNINMFKTINEVLGENNFIIEDNKNIFNILKKLYNDTNIIDVAKFIDYFPDIDEQKKVNNIINEIEKYDKKEREKLLNQQFKIVGNKAIDYEIDNINNIIKNLTDDDKIKYEKLLTELLNKKAIINKEYIKYEEI